MTKDEFLSLPVGVALRVLYEQMPQRMATVPVPPRIRPPKYDGRIARKGGYCWMSELDVEGIRFWHGKKLEGANGNGQYAEKDAKDAKALAYWLEWRLAEPNAAWSGERNHQAVTALAPSSKPQLHQWESRGGASETKGAPADTDADYFGGETEDRTGGGSDSEYGF